MDIFTKIFVEKPFQVFLCILIPWLLLVIILWDEPNTKSTVLKFSIVVIPQWEFIFNTMSKNLDKELNEIIKKHNISKDKLFQITRLSNYELTENEGQFKFHVSPRRKKKYLNMLKEYYE